VSPALLAVVPHAVVIRVMQQAVVLLVVIHTVIE
jgi:hypothetical protein